MPSKNQPASCSWSTLRSSSAWQTSQQTAKTMPTPSIRRAERTAMAGRMADRAVIDEMLVALVRVLSLLAPAFAPTQIADDPPRSDISPPADLDLAAAGKTRGDDLDGHRPASTDVDPIGSVDVALQRTRTLAPASKQ